MTLQSIWALVGESGMPGTDSALGDRGSQVTVQVGT